MQELKGSRYGWKWFGGTSVHYKEFNPEIESKLKKTKYFNKEWYPFVLPSPPNLDINFTIFFRVDSLDLFITPYNEVLDEF